MPRRVSLPGADELFRTTGGATLQAPQPRQHTGGEAQLPAQGDTRQRPAADDDPAAPVDGASAQRPGGRPDADAREDGEHGGRDTAAVNGSRDGTRESAGSARRPIGERPAAAAAATPTVSATVTPHAPPAVPAVPGVPNGLGAAAAGAGAKNSVPPQGGSAAQAQPGRRKSPRPSRRPSGRERHDEKITVYVSAEELMDLEHARLVLRGEHGLAIDRGRIVREAVAVVLADLESRGDASILVRRLRGR